MLHINIMLDNPEMNHIPSDDDCPSSSKRSRNNEENSEANASRFCNRPSCLPRNRYENGLIITVIEKSVGRDLSSSDENDVEISENLSVVDNSCNLYNLPTCVLLHLLGFLDSTSLYQLSR